jgi:hypothetical protein
MALPPNHFFSLADAAQAYALSAERIGGDDATFLDQNKAIIPIFVSQLFQSLEISIKYVGISSKLFTESEVRTKNMRSGHGLSEIASLAAVRLGGTTPDPLVMAMTYFNRLPQSSEIISKMIYGKEFEKTRESYGSRNLGYGQVGDKDFALIQDISMWVESVKQTALHLPQAVEVVSKWRSSPSASGHFAIWVSTGGPNAS